MNIRSIIFALLVGITLILPSTSFAQNPPVNTCQTITDANFRLCCSNPSLETEKACTFFYVDNQDRLCSAVSYGTPNHTLCCVVNHHPNCLPQGGGATLSGTSSGTPPTTGVRAPAPAVDAVISQECKQVMGTGGRIQSFLDILLWIRCVITVFILPLIFSIGFIVFMYGVIRYVIAGDSKEKEEGKKFLMWGLIGLFVMVSIWGIVGLVSNTLGLENTVPQLQQNIYCDNGGKYDPVTQKCR